MLRSAPIKVLLVEDNPADARLTRELLREVEDAAVAITHVTTMAQALTSIDDQSTDVVLLDLSLPDAHGVASLDRLREKNPRIPIVVLSGLSDQSVSIDAMQRGAQDYLVKGQGTGELIFRAIRYSIERKRTEIQILQEKEKADLANRAKTEFLANMSHELRTPLNAIIGFSDIMQRELFGPQSVPQYKEYAQTIHESGSHLLQIINDILDISKVEAGRYEINDDAVVVEELMRTCLRLISARAADSDIAVTLDLSPALTTVQADERVLKQIVLNLLSNAVKFTPAGGRVRLSTGVEPDGRAVISVTDTGIGISGENLPKVFLPFFQVEGSLSRRFEGTGLGLPLVKSMVELHGGSFELTSTVGVGTTATVRLPVDRILRPPQRAAAGGQ